MYDYLIVGAGLFGSIFAHEANERGKRVLVIEKRNHIGGNLYTKKISEIDVHLYGAHIFHTSNEKVWDYINNFTTFNNYINSPIANYYGEIYNLPFNMNTFNKMWGVITPQEAKEKLAQQIKNNYKTNPKNLEEQAINLVGPEIYEKLVKHYTEKQWGLDATLIPAFIIRRLPVRFTYNNNYFNDKYQGIPIDGYTTIFNKLLKGIDVILNVDYFSDKEKYDSQANKVLYTGALDEFYNYQYGTLDYRSLEFKHECLDIDNYQGNAVVNYTDQTKKYTRIIEHKHFNYKESNKTIITKEYPLKWQLGLERYYPINNNKNQAIYQKYHELAIKEPKHLFGGRLAEYKYYDMDDIIEKALELVGKELEKKS